MNDLKKAAQQALEAMDKATRFMRDSDYVKLNQAINTLRAALAQQEQEPVAWTDRELELIDGMIEVQLHHAAQCDAIANRPMAEKQKGWDMERVALLHKIKSISPRREWQGLTEEEIEDMSVTGTDSELRRQQFARAIEAALKEKNQ
jgi:hypothetical protein